MKVYAKFETTDKVYRFNASDGAPILVGGIYYLTVDNGITYENPVKIVKTEKGRFISNADFFRTIMQIKPVRVPKIKKPYEKILVNNEKEVVVIIWRDGTKTIMKPQPGDTFDAEKGIAMAFMKKMYHNRGCFNDAFRDAKTVKGKKKKLCKIPF